MSPEPFDIKPWREYLEAFDAYLLDGRPQARAEMRHEFERTMTRRSIPLTIRKDSNREAANPLRHATDPYTSEQLHLPRTPR